jgi:hypothetical protein
MLAMVLPRQLGRDVMSVPSHAGNDAAKQLGHGAMSVPSHACDDVVEATWSWRDIATDDHANVTSCQISM